MAGFHIVHSSQLLHKSNAVQCETMKANQVPSILKFFKKKKKKKNSKPNKILHVWIFERRNQIPFILDLWIGQLRPSWRGSLCIFYKNALLVSLQLQDKPEACKTNLTSLKFFFYWQVTHAPNESWTHDLTLPLKLTRSRGASWARAHWKFDQ